MCGWNPAEAAELSLEVLGKIGLHVGVLIPATQLSRHPHAPAPPCPQEQYSALSEFSKPCPYCVKGRATSLPGGNWLLIPFMAHPRAGWLGAE